MKTVSAFLAGTIYKTGEAAPPRFLDGFLPSKVSATLQKIPTRKCKQYYRVYFADFSNDYKLDLPNSYRTRLIADELGDDVRVLIWKIGSMGKRTTFKHSVEW